MPDVLSPAVPELLAAIRVLAAEQVAPRAAELDRDRTFPADDVAALGRAGALGLLVPAAHGGAGGGLVAIADACEAVGGASASTGMVLLMHSVTAATVAAGGGDRAPELLAGMAAGTTLGTLAFSERGTGAHFYTPELRAERAGDGVRIDGRKSFVTSGGHAGVLLVLVQSADGEGLDCYAVDGDAPGVRFEGEWDGLGMTGNASVAAAFDGVRVGDDARIGGPGSAGDLVFGVVAPVFLAGLAAVNVGHRAGGRRRRGRACGGAPLRRRDGARGAADDPAPARRDGRGHARRAAARARRGGAGRGRRPGRARRAHGGQGHRDGGGAARDAARAGGVRRAGLLPLAADRAAPARRARRRGDGADQRGAEDVDRQGPGRAPGAVMGDQLLVGAVSYHPRVVTIWERFRTYFADAGVPTDYVLFSNYERLVDAVLAGTVDIGWNTNTAYVTLDRRAGGATRILGMRDVDADWATVLVMRKDAATADIADLAGRTLALGSRDSGHAAILPLHYLARQGLDAARVCTLLRFDTDLGKHGDTGDSERRVVGAVAAGEADAGALSAVYLSAFRADRLPEVADLEVVWRSPTYHHCNFTVLDGFDAALAERWTAALLAMDYDDPTLRPAMELESVRQWLPGGREGYASLFAAMAEAEPVA